MRVPARIPAALALVALGGTAHADDLFVLTRWPTKVVRIDGTSGAVLDPDFCDVQGLLGVSDPGVRPIDAAFTGMGELLVSDDVTKRLSIPTRGCFLPACTKPACRN